METYERRWETRGERRRDGGRGGRSASDASRTSYYDLPAVKRPHWKWLIITYFFLGGIAGASYAVATLAELFGDRDSRGITRVGRYCSLATLIPCPILLILDLGRPERFLYMLRILKLRSPMSVGTWGLLVFSAFSAASAFIQAAEDGLFGGGSAKGSPALPGGRLTVLAAIGRALPGRTVGLLGLAPACFVAGYTGVLLAATAVPLWAKCYLLLPPLFLTSALSNATAAIALVLSCVAGTSRRALLRLERLDRLALLGELVLLLVLRLNAGRVIWRPLAVGHLGRLSRYGVLGLGIVAPLLFQAGAGAAGVHASPVVTAIASVLVLAGGFTLRYVVVMAGRASADDPQASFTLAGGPSPGSR